MRNRNMSSVITLLEATSQSHATIWMVEPVHTLAPDQRIFISELYSVLGTKCGAYANGVVTTGVDSVLFADTPKIT